MRTILEPDERVEQFDMLIHTSSWSTLIEEFVLPTAREARRVLLTESDPVAMKSAQMTLQALKRVVEAPYHASKNKVPVTLSLLWDP